MTEWDRYIQVLPQPDDFSQPAIPLVWNDEDISWLQGTYLEDSVSNYRKDLELHWSEAMEVLKRADWDVSSYTMLVASSDVPQFFHIY